MLGMAVAMACTSIPTLDTYPLPHLERASGLGKLLPTPVRTSMRNRSVIIGMLSQKKFTELFKIVQLGGLASCPTDDLCRLSDLEMVTRLARVT